MKKSRKVQKTPPFTTVLPPAKEKQIDIPSIPGMSLNEYLTKHFSQRVLDNVLRKWYVRKDPTNPKKTKEEWDKIIESFYNEK